LQPSHSFNTVADSVFIGYVGSIVADDGRIYLRDDGLKKIIMLNERFSFLGYIGQPGLGPGELHSPLRLRVHDKTLYIYNKAGTTIDIYAENGNFVHSYPLPFQSTDFAVGTDSVLYFPAYPQDRKSAKIWGATLSGEIVEKFGSYSKDDFKYPGGRWQELAQDAQGDIISIMVSEPVIEKYAGNGQLVDRINLRGIQELAAYWHSLDVKRREAAANRSMIRSINNSAIHKNYLFLATSYGESYGTIIVLKVTPHLQPVTLLRVYGNEENGNVWPGSICVTAAEQMILYDVFSGNVFVYDLPQDL